MDPVKERVIQHLKLAQTIAAKYFNIQGASREEILSEAQTALVKASMAYQEEKGPFAPFAGAAIRNALNSLYKKQLRQVQMIGKSLDETIHGATQFGTHIGNLGQNLKDNKRDVLKEVDDKELAKKISIQVRGMSFKEKNVLKLISEGYSLQETADKLGVSKQAIHKTCIKIRSKISYLKKDL